MLTFGDLVKTPSRFEELQGDDVLVGASGRGEVVLRDAPKNPEATMIFQHETIAMMRAERADRLDKLRAQLGPKSVILAIRKKPSSFWDQITVGRAGTADIVLEDPAISNVHAHFELMIDDNPVSVQDLGSSNGTHVNRVPLQPHTLTPIRSGDCIRFGQTVFYYVANSTLKDLIAK